MMYSLLKYMLYRDVSQKTFVLLLRKRIQKKISKSHHLAILHIRKRSARLKAHGRQLTSAPTSLHAGSASQYCLAHGFFQPPYAVQSENDAVPHIAKLQFVETGRWLIRVTSSIARPRYTTRDGAFVIKEPITRCVEWVWVWV